VSLWQAVSAGALLLTAAEATACGICDEDKVAATYDYAVIREAAGKHQTVAFAAVGGLDGVSDGLAQALRNAVASSKGVVRDSVRVSPSPPAISFAFDPAVQAAQSLLVELQKQFEAKGLQFRLIKVLQGDTSSSGSR
jgi:hypothetical protein